MCTGEVDKSDTAEKSVDYCDVSFTFLGMLISALSGTRTHDFAEQLIHGISLNIRGSVGPHHATRRAGGRERCRLPARIIKFGTRTITSRECDDY